jgi:hypothetical protein
MKEIVSAVLIAVPIASNANAIMAAAMESLSIDWGYRNPLADMVEALP